MPKRKIHKISQTLRKIKFKKWMAATEWEKKERDEVKSIESTVFTCARVKQNFKSLLVDNCICYFINWAKRTKKPGKKKFDAVEVKFVCRTPRTFKHRNGKNRLSQQRRNYVDIQCVRSNASLYLLICEENISIDKWRKIETNFRIRYRQGKYSHVLSAFNLFLSNFLESKAKMSKEKVIKIWLLIVSSWVMLTLIILYNLGWLVWKVFRFIQNSDWNIRIAEI